MKVKVNPPTSKLFGVINWKELGKQLWAAVKPVLLAAIGGGTASTVQEYAAMLNDGESEIITEAVNIKEKNPVLFVFTEGVGFPVSNIIKQVTKSKFSHTTDKSALIAGERISGVP